MGTNLSRRQLLTASATAIGASIAGCNGNPDDTNRQTSTDSTETPGAGTSTEEDSIQLDIQNKDIEIIWSPDMDQVEEIPDEHTANAKVTTSGNISLKDVKVILENDEETQRLEPDSNGNLELPADQLQEGETTVYATNGAIQSNQETVSKQVPDAFRVDFNFAGEGFNDGWDTVYAFDDQEIDLDALDRWHTNDFQKFGWTGFVSALATDGMPGEPYSTYNNWTDNSYGQYVSSEWLDSNSLEESMTWWLPAFLQYSSEAKDGVSSSNYDHMAATLEESYARHKDRDLHAWGFNSPVITDRGGNHGSVLVQDWQEDQLWLAFPTSESFKRPSESEYRETDEIWHPLLHYQGEDPNEQHMDYSRAKLNTQAMMWGIVSQDHEQESEGSVVGAFTDEYLLDAIGTMRNQETLTRDIQEQMQAAAKMIDTRDEEVVVYGDIDNPRYAITDNRELVDGVLQEEQTYTTEMVENALAS